MEIRVSGDRVKVAGYVNAVERDSRVLPPGMARDAPGEFVERIAAGAFARALAAGERVELRFNHGRALGSTADGCLQLEEDAIGLKAEAEITDPEAAAAARRGELRGWSFGFRPTDVAWSEEAGRHRRTVRALELEEVSILTVTPAYIATTVELRGEDTVTVDRRGSEDAPEIEEDAPPEEYYETRRAEIELERMKVWRNEK